MRIIIGVLLLLILSSGSSAQSNGKTQSKDEIKEAQRGRKETEQARKREEKDSLKHPPEIHILASPATVRSAIIRRMSEGSDYRLSDDSENRLVFKNPVGGFRGVNVFGGGRR